MLRWLRNRKKWQTRRKLLLQGRLDMLPLDQAWAEITQQQFADLVAKSGINRPTFAETVPAVRYSDEQRQVWALQNYDQHRLQMEYK